MKFNNKNVGDFGEKFALQYLGNKGYKFVEKNYKNKIGEIDLIMKDGEYLVFVEVKTRATNQFGFPREAVNYHKQNKIRKVATLYMMQHGCYPCACRFDVVEVLENEVTHLINAF